MPKANAAIKFTESETRGTARATRAGVLDPTMHGAAPEGVSPPHDTAPCVPLTFPTAPKRQRTRSAARKAKKAKPADTTPIAKKKGRPRRRGQLYENENTEVKVWRWGKPICSAGNCYTQVKEGEFFCKTHRQIKPNVRDDGVLKPIPLSRLMGRRA